MRRVLVVGRARGVWEEYAAARDLFTPDDVLVVGKVGVEFPDEIDHWVTFHISLLDRWVERRAASGYPEARNYWGSRYRGKPVGRSARPVRWVECRGGSSGMLALNVARRELLADCVVLAGVPMDQESGHCDEPEGQPWTEADKYWGAWEEELDWLREHVRSMSGRTRAVLGYPDREWLDAAES